MASKVSTRKKNRRTKQSKEDRARQKRDRKFKVDINTVFLNAGFTRIPTRNINININGRVGDIDSLFVYKNILVFVEDTTSATDSLKDHLLKSADYFKFIEENKDNTLKVLDATFPEFSGSRNPEQYENADYKWIFLYASYNSVDRKYELRHQSIKFLRYPFLQYFLSLSKTIGASARFELFKFLGLIISDIGNSKVHVEKHVYDAVVLPESPSSFPDGHKIVSFLIEPSTLLEQAYVLRKDGWRDSDCLYQRLLMKSKILSMRKYLSTEKRVFVNNIIATLPEDTIFLNDVGHHIDRTKLIKPQILKIELPRELSTMGLVDGQHRVFAYHEGSDQAEKIISVLREKQNLLVTGIVYPEKLERSEKTEFEAKLFLEINDKQTRAKGELRQAIETIVDPFSSIAIAKRIIMNMASTGPLNGRLEEYFFDKGKLKTTSIVSYGLKHLVGLESKDTLFDIWDQAEKDLLRKRTKKHLLNEYIDFCTSELNAFISAFRNNISPDLWTPDIKVSRVLTTTTINGLIFCLKRLVQANKTGDFNYYDGCFKKLNINFSRGKFVSSHWRALGDQIFKQCFE